MTDALREYCDSVAEQGAEHAHRNTMLFLECVREVDRTPTSRAQAVSVFRTFSFVNWAYINGVWSTMSNARLRRGLMSQSLDSIARRTALELCNDRTPEDLEKQYTKVHHDLQSFARHCTWTVERLTSQGAEPNANVVTLVALEQLQAILQLADSEMETVVPTFTRRVGDVARIEGVAKQILEHEKIPGAVSNSSGSSGMRLRPSKRTEAVTSNPNHTSPVSERLGDLEFVLRLDEGLARVQDRPPPEMLKYLGLFRVSRG
jgi:hypothetical protein